MVLSYSRQIFLGFFLDSRLDNFPRGSQRMEWLRGIISVRTPSTALPESAAKRTRQESRRSSQFNPKPSLLDRPRVAIIYVEGVGKTWRNFLALSEC
jgi:hypothetical protein